MNSVTLPLGSIAVIDKIEKAIELISGIFRNAGGKSKDFELKEQGDWQIYPLTLQWIGEGL